MRNLSIEWMDRIADALGVDAEMLVRSENTPHPQVVAALGTGGGSTAAPRGALLATDVAAKLLWSC
jgi:hypothetical protein